MPPLDRNAGEDETFPSLLKKNVIGNAIIQDSCLYEVPSAGVLAAVCGTYCLDRFEQACL